MGSRGHAGHEDNSSRSRHIQNHASADDSDIAPGDAVVQLHLFPLFPILLLCVLVFTLVYSPHLHYPYPLHIDEWHHITEAYFLRDGGYSFSSPSALEFGFHAWLWLLSFVFDLVKLYAFLPALAAVLSSLVLYVMMSRVMGRAGATSKASRQAGMLRPDLLRPGPSQTGMSRTGVWYGLAAMLCFAALRSNVYVMGLWFYSPMTAVIPLLFLLIYLLAWHAREPADGRRIWLVLFLYSIIAVVHPLSASFLLPILVLWYALRRDLFVRDGNALTVGAVVGICIAMAMLWQGTTSLTLRRLFGMLVFPNSWGVLNRHIPLMELYPLVLLALAVVGAVVLLWSRQRTREHLLLLLWPGVLLAQKVAADHLQWSVFVPYQRLVYYLILGLVPLSAMGLVFLSRTLHRSLRRAGRGQWGLPAATLLLILVCFFSFRGYGQIDSQVGLYHLIDDAGYHALLYLRGLPGSSALARPELGTTLYPVARKQGFGSMYFYGDRGFVERFFTKGCTGMQNDIAWTHADYVISEDAIDCGWELVYGPDASGGAGGPDAVSVPSDGATAPFIYRTTLLNNS
ncbi:hypothetical protein AUJ68_02300 [Candidatus Woesearchaeota archaeon CG1_02_57_44]|nr:MAG: hypothetical protein AUJ68_02300 [Candidatus Woesearchaeota archaeon CG1_02_57_44]PIN69796.1 MAG: hypothetical protein COV94_02495 [Candidatus Woesearchaeota archaeon CG11_big_fil_rev_8_21_14_0_20_57_5]